MFKMIKLSALVGILMLSLTSGAWAQDEPLIGDETPETPPPPPQPQPPPPPAAQPQPAPAPAAQPAAQPAPAATPSAEPGAMTPRKKKDITDTDHDMVLNSLGFQIVYIANIGPMLGAPATPTPTPLIEGQGRNVDAAVSDPETKTMSGDSIATMGIRYWFTRRVGLDVGLGLFIGKALGADDPGVGFAVLGGVPFAIGVYRHVCMFAGPEVGFAFWHPQEDVNHWMFNLQGKAGVEFSLGFIDIPRVSLIGTFAFGLRIYGVSIADNSETEIVLGNDQGYPISSLFTTSIGLVWYI